MVDPPPEFESLVPLPRGRHALSPEEVAANQRARIATAIASQTVEHGCDGLTVERVIEAAGVSRSTFYHHFANKREALLASHELIFGSLLDELMAACGGEEEWPAKISAAVGAALDFAAARPNQFSFLSVGSLIVDAGLAERVIASHEQLATLMSGLRQEARADSATPECTERFLVAGLGYVLASHLPEQGSDLTTLRGELVELTLRVAFQR